MIYLAFLFLLFISSFGGCQFSLFVVSLSFWFLFCFLCFLCFSPPSSSIPCFLLLFWPDSGESKQLMKARKEEKKKKEEDKEEKRREGEDRKRQRKINEGRKRESNNERKINQDKRRCLFCFVFFLLVLLAKLSPQMPPNPGKRTRYFFCMFLVIPCLFFCWCCCAGPTTN